MKVYSVLLFFYNCAFLAHCAKSSGGDAYEKPICLDVNGFYCPVSSTCLPRTERCTGDDSKHECVQKTYAHCEYDQATEKFEVYRHSTPLDLSSLFVKNENRDIFDCLGRELAHQFITYRGLMYEFGIYEDMEFGARIQDPNDPNYEYNTRKITKSVYIGLSSCTYEQILEYTRTWSNYDLCSHNCQDFAKGLGNYLIRECVKSETSFRSDDEVDDFEFAQYIFSLASDGTCNDTLSDISGTQRISSLSALIITTTALIIDISMLLIM